MWLQEEVGVPALYFLDMDRTWIALVFGIELIFGVRARVTFPAAELVAAVEEERQASVRLKD